MISPHSLSVLLVAAFLLFTRPLHGQTSSSSSDDAIRVTVSLNNDGSRTVYQFESSKHQVTATTTESNGKPRGKVIYETGEGGRFVRGVAFGPDDRFLFKALYKYDSAGRLEEDTRLTNEESVINKVVYKYDANGKQTGVSLFDASGKLISGGVPPSPIPSASKPRGALGR